MPYVEPGDPHACADAQRVCEDARTTPCPSTRDHVRRVLAALVQRSRAPSRARGHVRSPTAPARAGSVGQDTRGRRIGRRASRCDARGYSTSTGSPPDRAVVTQFLGREHHTVDSEQGLCERASVHARGALLCRGLRGTRRGRAARGLRPVRSVRPSVVKIAAPALEGKDGREHLERALVHLGERRYSRPRDAQCWLHEALPRQPPPSRSQSRRARRGAPGSRTRPARSRRRRSRRRRAPGPRPCRCALPARPRTRPGSMRDPSNTIA